MSTTSGGDTTTADTPAQDNSVTTVYNDGDRTAVNHRASTPPSSSYADSGLDMSNTESTAGDAKLIIDVPDFSREMETPRAGIDNPSFETDKTDVPKPLANGHNGTVNQENGRLEKDKMAEAVNLELINMKPFAKSANGMGNGVPTKKKETAVNMNDTYDDYFIPVNEHKKYMRGGEKLYVTKDKRDMNQSRKPFMCWVFGLVLLAAAVIIAILASTGFIFNNDAAVESRNFGENEKLAGFGNHLHTHSSSVSPPPSIDNSGPFSPPTTDMSGLYVPRTLQGEIVIDNMEFTPGMSNKSNPEFQSLARSIESELKTAIFKEQTLNGASDGIHVKVIEFSSGSVVAKYRIGWEYKDDSEPQDLIDAETLKTRLDSYLREYNGFLYNYRIPIHRLRSDPVMDKCKTENGKCSHFCSYDYTSLDFICSCPSELILSENMKDCKRIEHNNAMDDDDDNFDEKPFDYFSENVSSSSSEPEPSSEPGLKAEPEPSSEPEVKVEPVPNSEPDVQTEPEVKSEPELISEPESKAEPEPETNAETASNPEPTKTEPESNSEPEVKTAPEPSSEYGEEAEPIPNITPEFKAQPESSPEPEPKTEPEPSSMPTLVVEPEPSSEPKSISEPEPSSEPTPHLIPEPNTNVEPEPSSEPSAKVEPEPSSEHVDKTELKPSTEPAAKTEPKPNSEPAVNAEPEPSSEPVIKVEPEPKSEPAANAEPEPSLEPVTKVEPEPSSEPASKAEPEPSSAPEVIPSSVSESKPEPEPSAEPNSKSNPIDIYESLSDVDVSSELDTADQNNNAPVSSSTEKSILNVDQTDREAKSHSEEVFNHEIKPEVTFSVSTESEFETKTESMSVEDSKPKEPNDSLGNVNFNAPEESSTLPTITENWLTTTVSSSIQGIPKLPSDLEVTEKENGAIEEEIKTENTTPLNSEQTELKSESSTLMGIAQTELKSGNKYTDTMPESNNTNSFQSVTELPKQSISDNLKDMPSIITEATMDVSSTSMEHMSSSTEELENISVEHVTEYTIPSTVKQIMPIKKEEEPQSSGDMIKLSLKSSGKEHSDDLTSLDKNNLPDPTKKLQSLTALEEQVVNLPVIDVTSSTPSIIDNMSENSSVDEHDSLDQIMAHVGEQNVADIVGEDEKSSALDLYQKPELKKKDKKTSKNPDLYVTDTGYTKRNKTKSEKENKKNSKPDFMDIMPEMMTLDKCEEGQFQCVNSTTKDGSYCIKISSRCDTNKDCIDNSDEYDCAENACSGNFQCKSGECLQRNLVCNNIMDCEDGSDEQICDSWKCNDDEKQCSNGQCLPASYFCDGKADCNDHSDELQCNSTCDGYKCADGYCISSALQCNGVNDCTGGEDEQKCECGPDEFKCNTSSQCILKAQRCDSVAQCADKSDEWQCVQLDGTQLLAKREGEISLKVCSTNWTDQWSDLVCKSLGFTETKTTNFRPNESTENVEINYLKLKDNSTLNSSESLTAFLELTNTQCETVEIKCSSKHLCGDFGGKDPLSMEMWPSVVYLHNTKTHKSCTSSLVKRNWLLSSYSCVHSVDESLSADQWEAVSSKTRVANESSLTKKSVSRIISHPGVKFEKIRYFNDTVLVQLSAPYDLSDEVNTICLPEQPVDNKQPCVTTSWSYESPGVFKQFSRSLSEPLMQTDVCNSTKNFNGILTKRDICVASGEMEATNMEIGSTLMCLAENGLWQLQGMLSYRGGYGRSSKPSLYNAVVDAVPWAENTIASGV